MRWKARSIVAGALCVAWSVPAHACGMWFNSTYIWMAAKPVISLGLQNVENYRIISADVSVKVGDKVALRPAVGQCSYTGSSGGSELVYGGAVAVNVWNDAAGKLSVNAQAGVEMFSYDVGSDRNIPVGLAVRYNLSGGSSASAVSGLAQGGSSGNVSLYGGAAMHIYNEDFGEGESDSSTDPAVFGGAMYQTGQFQLTGGITMYMYDGGSELAINVGGGFALGSTANAIRSIGSLFRK